MTLVDFLDREHQQLIRRNGTDLLLALRGYLATLNDEPGLRPVIARVETEATTAIEAFVAKQNELIERARHWRDEFVALAPEADDSDMEEPDQMTGAYIEFEFSLARFDQLVSRDSAIGFPPRPDDHDDPGPVSRLLNILGGRLMVAQYGERADIVRGENRRPDLDPMGVTLRNLNEEQAHALRGFRQASRSLPGVALARIRHLATNLNPEPHIVDPAADDWMGQALERVMRTMFTQLALVQRAVNGELLDDGDQRRFDEVVDQTREQIERAHEGLVRAARIVEREQAARPIARVKRFGWHVYERYVIGAAGTGIGFLIGWLVGR